MKQSLQSQVKELASTVEALVKLMQAQAPAPTPKVKATRKVKTVKPTKPQAIGNIPVISGDGFISPAMLYTLVEKQGKAILRGRALCCYLKVKFSKGLGNPFHAEKVNGEWVVSIAK